MNVVGRKKIFLTASGFLVAASVAAIAIFGFRLGIDFRGGTLWQIRFEDAAATRERLAGVFGEKLGIKDAIVTPTSGGGFFVRLPETGEADHLRYREILAAELGSLEELRFETIGSSIGKELRRKAITAFLLVLFTISLYIAFVFRKVSRPVSSWKYGVITLITLFHDAAIPAGLMALLGEIWNAEIDTNFIVAILVVIGFSVHDTIVVFDRIRENLRVARGTITFPELVNQSVNQTFARSLNTSLTLVLVLLALLTLGAGSLTYFVLTILVGTIVGTYSSIFVASPLLTMWRRRGSS